MDNEVAVVLVSINVLNGTLMVTRESLSFGTLLDRLDLSVMASPQTYPWSALGSLQQVVAAA